MKWFLFWLCFAVWALTDLALFAARDVDFGQPDSRDGWWVWTAFTAAGAIAFGLLAAFLW